MQSYGAFFMCKTPRSEQHSTAFLFLSKIIRQKEPRPAVTLLIHSFIQSLLKKSPSLIVSTCGREKTQGNPAIILEMSEKRELLGITTAIVQGGMVTCLQSPSTGHQCWNQNLVLLSGSFSPPGLPLQQLK
jgi:hypothetical protein